ncbi:MAG: dipeptidase PepE [Planctomycetes bacterium]|nr:dipeptidase PepE [Planctomycetota bacterium]
MFDRFTDRAKRLMSASRLIALQFQHEYIAPEHLLLAMLSQPSGIERILTHLQIDSAALLADLTGRCHPGAHPVTASQLPFTPAAKRVLECTLKECAMAQANHIDADHVLAGLVVAEDSIAAQALKSAGLTIERLRPLLGGSEDPAAPERDNRRCRLLLISNSTMHGGGYLEHCATEIRDFLGARKRVLFVPYALANHDEYAARAATAFTAFGHELTSAHRTRHPLAELQTCDAVFIGGGNTFRLLNALYMTRLLEAIADRARHGMPYIGSSAGTNVATLSIRTTNDMPIVQPPSFTAMSLVPFQINPHYLDPDAHSKHMGETREERLRQFHEEHATPVLGLREGCLLRVEGERLELRGTTRARLFLRGQPAQEHTPPCDLSFLLQLRR